MIVQAQAAAAINDLACRDPTEFMLAPVFSRAKCNPTGRLVTLPRDGIVMPDASFFASNTTNDYCLVTIQSKVTKKKLERTEFSGAIRSTSTSHTRCLLFLRVHSQDFSFRYTQTVYQQGANYTHVTYLQNMWAFIILIHHSLLVLYR